MASHGVALRSADWKADKIGNLFQSWGGHTPSKSNSDYWGEGVPWVSSKEIKAPKLTTSTHLVTRQAVDETGLKVCPIGTVLVVMRSGVLAHTLPIAITEVPVTINQDVKAFYSEQPLMNEWLALFLRMSAQSLLASSRRDGTTVQSIQYPLLKDTMIPVPPLEERRAIIEAVDRALEKQREAVPHLAAAKQVIDRFRGAVLEAACSGQLTADLRQDPLLTNGDLLADWTKSTVAELCRRVSVGHVGPTSNYYTSRGQGIAFIRSQNVRPGRLVLDGTQFITREFHESLQKSQLQPGDVLIVRVGANRGDCCMVPLEHVGDLNCANIVFARPVSVDPEYLTIFLRGRGRSLMLNKTTGSAQGVINTKAVAAIQVDVPSMSEQREIVRRVRRLEQIGVEVERRVRVAIGHVDRSAQAILAKALRGELGPGDT